jgi:nucleotide-binding universal stress UspA family protein
MSTILVGVDSAPHSLDAIALARQLARCSSGRVVVACAFRPNSDTERDAEHTAQRMSLLLEDVDASRISTRAVAASLIVDALNGLSLRDEAAIVIVGSSHAGQLAQMVPSGTAARLLRSAPCAVAVAPEGYRARRDDPIRRIGVAYDGSAESRGALAAAVEIVHAVGAELEVITVHRTQLFATPTMMGGPGYLNLDEASGRRARAELDAAVAGLRIDRAAGTVLNGGAAHRLILHSTQLDLLLLGSRGYNPLHAMLARGVSARVIRDAQCPVIAIPRGTNAPLAALFSFGS